MTTRVSIVFLAVVFTLFAQAQTLSVPPEVPPPLRIAGAPAQRELLWQKLDATLQQVNHDLNGTMGVAIVDLTDGRTLLLNPDAVCRSSEYGRINDERNSH